MKPEILPPAAPAVLRALSRHQILTRGQLSELLQTSGPTVTRAIDALCQLQVVTLKSSERVSGGRPPEDVSLAPDGLCSIVILLRSGAVEVRLLDQRSRAVDRRLLELHEGPDYDATVRVIAESVSGLYDAAQQRFAALAGVGIAFGGSVDHNRHTLSFPSAFPTWHDKPLADDISRLTQLPCSVENYATALVRAVNWFENELPQDFFLVFADHGIGGSACINDGPYLGRGGSPRTFGHVYGRGSGSVPCYCGRFDCLVTDSSLAAVFRAVDAQGLAGTQRFADLSLSQKLDHLAGDPSCRLLVERAAARIATAAVDTCQALDLRKSIFSGLLFDRFDNARDVARATCDGSGADLTCEFLIEKFGDQSIDNLAANALVYDALTELRQLHILKAAREKSDNTRSRLEWASA